jgi:hypothetical protein
MDPVAIVTLRAALALLFTLAATHKLRDMETFRGAVAGYRLLPAPFIRPAAVALASAELAAAALLVASPGWPAAGPLLAAALFLLYAGAIAVNLAVGRRDIDCGCAGPGARRPISGWLVVRNVALAIVALAAAVPVASPPRALVWIDALTIAGAVATLVVAYASIDRLLANLPAVARARGIA